MQPYSPEGIKPLPPTADELRRCAGSCEIFQARCTKCDELHNLHLDIPGIHALIPREEAALGIREGTTNEMAILSRVGKWVSFQVLGFDSKGTALLSRRSAQAEARSYYLNTAHRGDVLQAVVINPSAFGVFCDIGCGFPALMRIQRCCISRLDTTAALFRPGQQIFAAIVDMDDERGLIHLSGRELLGTWEENAALFRTGQTVTGCVRSIMPYGAFVELTPNLSGLAELTVPMEPGDPVSVYIRSIQPNKHKVKLTVLEKLDAPIQTPFHYFHTAGRLEQWEYYPGSNAITYF
jgi:small subunit ribosomal protein S1